MMTSSTLALRQTPEPVKKHVNEESLSREIIINGFVEDKGTFKSSFEAGQPKADMSRPRPLLIRFASEWVARKCLSKNYRLKNYHERIFISQSLSKEDQATKRKLLQKRYERINSHGVPR